MSKLDEMRRTMDRYEMLSKRYLETKKGWIALEDARTEIDVNCIDWLRALILVVEAAREISAGFDFITYDRPSAMHSCLFCEAIGDEDEVVHKDDCPVKALEAALAKLTATVPTSE